MQIKDKVAIITGAASGIGRAAAEELIKHEVAAVGLVDVADTVFEIAETLNKNAGREVALPFQGDTTDEMFRKNTFDSIRRQCGGVNICIPAAGITRDALAVKLNKTKGRASLYPIENFRQVMEVNLIAPIYWALELVGQMAEDRFTRGLKQWSPDEGVQGVIVFIGSVSSQGNKGQISYATTKVGIEGAASTLMKEAMHYGVRCTVIHPASPIRLWSDPSAKNISPSTCYRPHK